MRAIWSGAVSFGLVSVPIKVYSATTNHDVRFHQVHGVDGGRIRYKRTCQVCDEVVEYADIAKGYETPDGELITLDENDLNSLPVATGHEIDVIEFVPADQIDPLLFDKSYFLEPETKAAKPYALLREALTETDRMAVVKVALRQRETIALLRVRGKAIVLQTMLWPDEVREPEFDILETDVELRPQELQMASSLVESMGADFDPADFHDDYRDAVVELIESKKEHGDARPAPAAEKRDDGADSMSDLLSALQASVDAARGGSESSKATSSKATSSKTTSSKAEPSKAESPKTDSDTGDGEKKTSTRRKTPPSGTTRSRAKKTEEPAADSTDTTTKTTTRKRTPRKTA